jgi:hypothetical protein
MKPPGKAAQVRGRKTSPIKQVPCHPKTGHLQIQMGPKGRHPPVRNTANEPGIVGKRPVSAIKRPDSFYRN